MLRVTDEHRRVRIARRHGLAPQHRHRTIVDTTTAMTALHATEGTTVHLALHARMNDLTVVDVEDALYTSRSLVKQMCMRRTIFALTREHLPAAVAGAGRRVGAEQRRRLESTSDHIAGELGDAWIEKARAEILETLTDRPRSAKELRGALSHLAGTVRAGSGKWVADTPVMTRLLVMLWADGDVVRGANAGHWRISRPVWAAMDSWLGRALPDLASDEGYAQLVRNWLWTFGPGTEADLVWWLGSTKTAARKALAANAAVPVELENGMTGWVLPDDTADLERPASGDPWVALLPTLDPTTMGWKERHWYLDDRHRPYLFDSTGNGGTTVWVDGRVVGCWVQDEHAHPRLILLEDVDAAARRSLDLEVERLHAFLQGERITNVFASHLVRGTRLP